MLSILAVAAFLRLVWLDHQDLWVDEINTYHDALNLKDRSPLSYHYLSFVTFRLALLIKDSTFWLRVPSALAGLLTVIPIYGLFRLRLERVPALLMAGLLAVAPFHVHFSTEARYYSEVILFFSVALYFAGVFALRGSIGALILFFVFGGLACLCHPAAGSSVIGALAGAVGWAVVHPRAWSEASAGRYRRIRERVGTFWARTFLVFEVLLLLVIFAVGVYLAYQLMLRRTLAQWNEPLPDRISFSWRFFWWHFQIPARGRWSITGYPAGSAIAILAIIGVALAWWRHRFFALLFTCVYGVTLGLLFVSRADIQYAVKYSSAIFPAFLGFLGITLLEAGHLFSRLFKRGNPLQWAGGFTVLTLVLWAPFLYVHSTGQFMPLRETFDYVEKHSPGQERPVIVVQGFTEFVMNYYAKSDRPALLPMQKDEATWPKDALQNFIDRLAASGVPVWAAVVRSNYDQYPAGMGPTWEYITTLESLYNAYDVLIFRWETSPAPEKETQELYEKWGYRLEAEDFDSVRPLQAGISARDGRRSLDLMHAVTASYHLSEKERSFIAIRVAACNSADYNRLLEIRLDDEPLGVLVLEPGDGFTTQTVSLSTALEGRTLEISLLDSNLAPNYSPTYEKDRVEIDAIFIRPPSTSDRLVPRSDSALQGMKFVAPVPPYDTGSFSGPSSPGIFLPGYQIVPRNVPWTLRSEKGGGPEVLTLEIGRKQDTTVFATPFFKVKPGLILYGSIDVKVQDLFTHSANVRVTYKDAEQNDCAMAYASTIPLHGDSRWRPLVFLNAVPETATSVVITVDIWRVGKPTRWTNGRVLVRNFRLYDKKDLPAPAR